MLAPTTNEQVNGRRAGLHGGDLEDPDAVLAQAKELLRAGHMRESETLFRRLAASGTAAAKANGHYGVGCVRLSEGDLGGAVECFNRALAHDPMHANAVFQIGGIAQRVGDREQARVFFELALRIDPGHVSANVALARLPQPPARVPPSTAAHVAAPAAPATVGVYEYLREDPSALSRQTVELIEQINRTSTPRFRAYVGRHPLVHAVLFVLLPLGLIALIVGAVRVRSTKVTLARGRLQIDKGVFTKRLINIELWRVQTIELRRTFINRLTGDGTLILTVHTDMTTRRSHNPPKPIKVSGIAAGQDLQDLYQELLNLVFLLKSHPAVKGIIQ